MAVFSKTSRPIWLRFCKGYDLPLGNNPPSIQVYGTNGPLNRTCPLPYFSHPVAFDLTMLTDRVSDRDEISARKRSIMGLHDPAHAIDLARYGNLKMPKIRKVQFSRKYEPTRGNGYELRIPCLRFINGYQLLCTTLKKICRAV